MPADGADLRSRNLQGLRGNAIEVSRGLRGILGISNRGGRALTTERITRAVVTSTPVAAFVGAFLGCFATLHLVAFGFVPAIASALAASVLCGSVIATRTTSLLPGEFFVAIYGGTFAGMTPMLGLGDNAPAAAALPASALFVLLSVVSGLVFLAVAELDSRSGRRLATGYGGRSGTIATVASLLFVETAPLLGADGRLFRGAHAEMLKVDPISVALLFAGCMMGLSATLLALRQRSVASAEPAERIFIAAAVALLGLIGLHLIDPNDMRNLDAFYAGCFLGMSAPERLKGRTQVVLGAVLLTAILILVKALLPDLGGELGFAALASVVVLVALSRMADWLSNDNPVPGGILEIAHASANGRFMPAMPTRDAITLACSFAGLLVIGWLSIPLQVASEQPTLDWGTETEQVAEQPAPVLQPASLQAAPGTVDPDVLPGAPSTKPINADLRTVTPPAPEAKIAANQTAPGLAGGDAGAQLGHAGTAEGAATATADAVKGGTAVDDMTNEELFREFMRWRAANSSAIAQSRPQPAKRSRNTAVQMVRLTNAGLRINPRSPAPKPTVRPAPGQPRP